jgi:sensitive to high expression protein 9, mitochondrial
MALIRSEHAHDQAVSEAKEAVTTAEKALEEARMRLEKRERAQYHEEQIWSDTIRRNGTWVTLGLMGVNIALLVVNLVAVEPWRRKRLVGEIKGILEGDRDSRKGEIVADTIAAVEEKAIAAVEVAVEGPSERETIPEEALAFQPIPYQPLSWDWVSSYFRHPFDDQMVSIHKVDLTSLALQAAAAGAVVTYAIMYILKAR